MPKLAALFIYILLFFSSCNINNITIDKTLQQYFDRYQTKGSFALLDNGQAHFTIYDSSLYKKRFLPASTFEIVNSLIGLETGKISDEKMIIKWDEFVQGRAEQNKEMTMEEAFKVSLVPYFREVARRIGRDTMQRFLDTLNYGTKSISGSVDSFWLNNTLKISADEQLGLVKRLYFDQLPFQKRTQQIVRKAMLIEDNSLFKLSYKTGWGFDENGANIGWMVGWIEENRHPYFFVLLLKNEDKNYDMRIKQKNLLTDILKHHGFMQGKK